MRFLQSLVAGIVAASTVYASSTARDPLNYVSLLEEPQINSPSGRVHASSSFDITFDLHKHGESFRLSLEPNYDIFHQDSQIQFLNSDGTIRRTERINREDHKVFQGQAYEVDKHGISTHVGWARVVVLRDGVNPLFEGAFSVYGDHHHIQLRRTYMSTKHVLDPELDESDDEFMAVWRDSDVGQQSRTDRKKREMAGERCSADKLDFNTDIEHPIFQDLLKRGQSSWAAASFDQLLGKRQSNIDGGGAGNGNSAGVNLRSTIGSTAGCPSTRRVALVGVASDCSYRGLFNSSSTLRDNIINVVNTASDLYQSTFNITLGLKNLTVIDDSTCPGTQQAATPWNSACSDSVTITQRLNLFSQWRSQQNDANAYWSLFTNCNTGAEVGLAWLGQLCNHGGTSQPDNSGNTQTVTGANVVARTPQEWQVFAHETGHTFGAVHDCTSSTCSNSNTVSASQCCPLSTTACDAQAQYLMNPYAQSGINRFSPCSIGNICSALGRNSVNSQCLTDNKNVGLVTGDVCGNGIVEEGEDCDCGGPQGCADNPCCNPSTCKFTTNSVCDPSNEGCCTQQCQFASAGTVCRASTGECDPEETCPGSGGNCPADKTADDGTKCRDGLQCMSGQCTSRDQQCKTAMGTYLQGNQTYACNSQTCIISCGSPDFGPSVCYSLQQNFLDGTPCGGDGRCSNGVCRGSSAGGAIRSWIDSNKTLVIALASVIGGLILLAILSCCWRACRRPRKNRVAGGRGRNRNTTNPNQGWNGPSVPPEMQQRGYGGGGQQYYPAQPPPTYNQYGHGGPSVRYA